MEERTSIDDSDPDPSTLETRQFDTADTYRATQPVTTPTEPDPAWGTPEAAVPPESGNRTLWIILGIVAFIVLVCCCLLPLGFMAFTSFDTAFQDQLRSIGKSATG